MTLTGESPTSFQAGPQGPFWINQTYKQRRKGLATRRRDGALLVRSFGDGSFPGVAKARREPCGGQRGIR
jgi:hypothetical protein